MKQKQLIIDSRKVHASDTVNGIYKILHYHELNKIPDLEIPACLMRRKDDIFGTDFEYMKE
uniref:Uncharacterized protein n=1 Tax=Octopus bimaculoides TaxID=37653 RepID=A0A0L8IAU8_OCTBM